MITPAIEPSCKPDELEQDLCRDGNLECLQEEVVLSQVRKWCLLAVFCLGVFMDVLGVCVFYILLEPVSTDLGVRFEQQTWIITSFGVTFAAFLLFWGRVADLYSPKAVFCWGFLVFGVLNLIISFLTEKYSFLIFRAFSGISAAAIVPASYRLITAVFLEHELPRAFTVYSISGSVAGATGVTIGGLVELIPNGGQLSGWRWYFRISAAIVIPISLWALWFIPKTKPHLPGVKGKWKRLDVLGTLIMLCAILLFILGLTMGASYGWANAGFIAPLILSFILLPGFFLWEARLPISDALIPPHTWKAKNFVLWITINTFGYSWWTLNQIPIIERWVHSEGDAPIIAALRLLPSGVLSLASSLLLVAYPVLLRRPRWTYTVGEIGGILGYVLFILSQGKTGDYYLKYYLPGLAVGSFFHNCALTCAVVGAMTSAPADQAGVVGAILQTATQAGNVIGITIQAGLMTVRPGGITDFFNVQTSFFFVIGWDLAFLVALWIFLREPTKSATDTVIMH